MDKKNLGAVELLKSMASCLELDDVEEKRKTYHELLRYFVEVFCPKQGFNKPEEANSLIQFWRVFIKADGGSYSVVSELQHSLEYGTPRPSFTKLHSAYVSKFGLIRAYGKIGKTISFSSLNYYIKLLSSAHVIRKKGNTFYIDHIKLCRALHRSEYKLVVYHPSDYSEL